MKLTIKLFYTFKTPQNATIQNKSTFGRSSLKCIFIYQGIIAHILHVAFLIFITGVVDGQFLVFYHIGRTHTRIWVRDMDYHKHYGKNTWNFLEQNILDQCTIMKKERGEESITEELQEKMDMASVVSLIRGQRIQRLGHERWSIEEDNLNGVHPEWKPTIKRPRRQPGKRWTEVVEEDPSGEIHSRDREKWRDIVMAVKNS